MALQQRERDGMKKVKRQRAVMIKEIQLAQKALFAGMTPSQVRLDTYIPNADLLDILLLQERMAELDDKYTDEYRRTFARVEIACIDEDFIGAKTAIEVFLSAQQDCLANVEPPAPRSSDSEASAETETLRATTAELEFGSSSVAQLSKTSAVYGHLSRDSSALEDHIKTRKEESDVDSDERHEQKTLSTKRRVVSPEPAPVKKKAKTHRTGDCKLTRKHSVDPRAWYTNELADLHDRPVRTEPKAIKEEDSLRIKEEDD